MFSDGGVLKAGCGIVSLTPNQSPWLLGVEFFACFRHLIEA